MYVSSYAPWGAEGIIIRVEADIRRGIPGVDITGLADGAVREARERIRAAFKNSGYLFPPHRILVNLAPAGVKKEGAALDLPIAVAVMAAAGIVAEPANLMILGELELSGRLRSVRGVLAAVAAGIEAGIRDFVVPLENSQEAAILPEARFFPAATLREVVHALMARAKTGLLPQVSGTNTDEEEPDDFESESTGMKPKAAGLNFPGDFSEVHGQPRYKRALEITAAGGHNLLVFGPPGVGKTMLARRVSTIMAPLEGREAVEVTRLYSLAGQLPVFYGGLTGSTDSVGLIRRPPFRSPHHSASAEGILGGGRFIKPGEISLAHRGVLFLDEAPEFRSSVLQSLREPLEDRVITISRAEGPVRLPADFQLILACNICPCGRFGGQSGAENSGDTGSCFCSIEEIRRYWRKIGGALLDRIELRILASSEGLGALSPFGQEETSAVIASRVLKAVEIQRERFKGLGTENNRIRRNAGMTPFLIERFCPMTPEAGKALRIASQKLNLSGRACHGILRTARTIADLEAKDTLDTVHILEAVEHRRLGDDPYDVFVRN